MDNDVKFLARKIFFDILLLLFVGIPILLFFLLGYPYRRGFYCDDESLMHPYHDSTVPSFYLYIFGLGMPVVLMTVTEFIQTRNEHDRPIIVGNRKIPRWVWNAYSVIIVFGFGAACSQLSTDIMKYTVGRLRPHFFAVCHPTINCSSIANKHIYHTDFSCANDQDGRLLKEVRLSFPSGHSSFSMYTMFYLAMYLQARWTWEGSKLLRHFFQYLFIILSVYTGMTRISDYKHHWSDVMAGLLLGMFVAVLTWTSTVSSIWRDPFTKSQITPHSEQSPLTQQRTNTYGVCVSDLFVRKPKPNLLPTIDMSEPELPSRNKNGGTSQL